MELRQLEYFQMASRLKNITRAAERLNVSQPNITVAIKKLETELGIQLFDRSQKQLSLTAEGEIFLNRVNQALRQLNDGILEMNDYKDLQKGSIKIGIPAMIGSYLFPRIFSSFKKKYPFLDVYLYEEGSIAIRDKLEKNELDFGIVILTNASTNLETLPMAAADIVACVSPENPLARCQHITPSDLNEIDMITLKEGSYLRQEILNTLKAEGVQPHIVLESNLIATIMGLVAMNAGVTFLPDFIAKDSHGITILPLKPTLSIELGVAWKKDRYLSKANRCFIDFCKTALLDHTL